MKTLDYMQAMEPALTACRRIIALREHLAVCAALRQRDLEPGDWHTMAVKLLAESRKSLAAVEVILNQA